MTSRKPAKKSEVNFKPQNPRRVPRFGGIATFSRLPYVTDIKGLNIDVGILGVPFDGGATYRSGARFGPRAIRAASVLCRNFNPDLDVAVYEKLRVADLGDTLAIPMNLQKTLQEVETTLGSLHRQKVRTITLGGDHSILLGELRAIRKERGKVVLIHFDAHTDTAPAAWDEDIHHGTPIRHGIEEGLIDGSDVFQIGIRGPLSDSAETNFIRKHKINQLPMTAFHHSKQREAFVSKLKKTAKGRPCFITFDVDGVDPAYAPGTGTPVVGGLTSLDALTFLRTLKGLQVIGGDVVEVAPAYDHAEITSLLASAIVFEMLSLMAASK